MVQTLKLENFFQDYFRETITNFLAVHMENGFLSLQKTNLERVRLKKLISFNVINVLSIT